MKKIFYILSIIAVISILVAAAPYNKSRIATADVTLYSGSAKAFLAIGGGGTNDTVRVNDTVTRIIAISAADDITASGQTVWKKVGAGKPTLTLQFYQSYDGVTYEPLKKGITRLTYTKTNSGIITSDSSLFWSFKKDTVYFEGKYLKILEITSNTSATKLCMSDYLYIKRK